MGKLRKALLFVVVLAFCGGASFWLTARNEPTLLRSPEIGENPVRAPEPAQETGVGATASKNVLLPINSLTAPDLAEDDLSFAVELAESGDREMAVILKLYSEALAGAVEVDEITAEIRKSLPARTQFTEARLDARRWSQDAKIRDARLSIKQMVRHRRLNGYSAASFSTPADSR